MDVSSERPLFPQPTLIIYLKTLNPIYYEASILVSRATTASPSRPKELHLLSREVLSFVGCSARQFSTGSCAVPSESSAGYRKRVYSVHLGTHPNGTPHPAELPNYCTHGHRPLRTSACWLSLHNLCCLA